MFRNQLRVKWRQKILNGPDNITMQKFETLYLDKYATVEKLSITVP